MKMSRSQDECENVQFVQELAEVDGPFESPININFKDLTKLDLPALVWNRSETCPKKMKITNTGHTVIISGKWKCERPYLTGGPLLGKYVFSQIHFHWGPDNCRGSEHLVCGEGFPLEMHVAHFKTDYLTQECALREKDGMVILVYLFKLQEEPNNSLKRILNVLPDIKKASNSQSLDPRPILSLCNPFTDDYFMYWGSVVTSTCAHILMWLVCREPFGISKEQVCEFRKILDSSQQPIYRNTRDTQPLHKRNVFHVNPSKNLDCPLLPIKNIFGCFCGRGNDDCGSRSKTCCCQGSTKNQEDIEGNYAELNTGYTSPLNGDQRSACGQDGPGNFIVQQSLVVQRATVQSTPLLPKLMENPYLGQVWTPEGGAVTTEDAANIHAVPGSKVKMVSQSCCFIPVKEFHTMKPRSAKRRTRRKPFNSMKALTHIMESLEALKNHTVRKLREIDSINQEIKGIKSFCRDVDDRKWLRRIEKMMTRQKRFTIKSSQTCLTDLKKLAKDCNFDQFFDGKLLSFGDNNNGKMMWLNNLPDDRFWPPDVCNPEKIKEVKSFGMGKALQFSTKAQKLIQSFFEDIKESEPLHQSLQKDLKLIKNSISYQSDNSKNTNSIASVEKGLITKKMFHLQNLGNRFFMEVDDAETADENEWRDKSNADAMFVSYEDGTVDNENVASTEEIVMEETAEDLTPSGPPSKVNVEEVIPLHRVNVAVGLHEGDASEGADGLEYVDVGDDDKESSGSSASFGKSSASEKVKESPRADDPCGMILNSSAFASTVSTEMGQVIMAKVKRSPSAKEMRKSKKTTVLAKKVSSKGLCVNGKKKRKSRNINLEGYYFRRKNGKSKKDKRDRERPCGDSSIDMSSLSKDDVDCDKDKWKHGMKTKFKLKIEDASDSNIESAIECTLMSPRTKKLWLKTTRLKDSSDGKGEEEEEDDNDDDDEDEESTSLGNTTSNVDERTSSTSRGTAKRHDEPITTAEEGTDPVPPDQMPFGMGDVSKEAVEVKDEQIATEEGSHRTEKSPALRLDDGRWLGEVSEMANPDGKPDDDHKKEIYRVLKNRSFTSVSTAFDKNRAVRVTKRIFIMGHEHRPRGTVRTKGGLDFLKKVDVSPVDDTRFAQELSVGYFTTSKSPDDRDHLPPTRLPSDVSTTKASTKNPKSRCVIEKYHFLDKELKELKVLHQTEPVRVDDLKTEPELVQKTESFKSFGPVEANATGDASIADPSEIANTISYTAVKKNSHSRPHSVESISAVKKTKKRRKKRPHCCKRASGHYMRKNSSSFLKKKPNKIECKTANFLNMTKEEKLKVISENVAKYLKKKMGVQKFDIDLNELGLIRVPSSQNRKSATYNPEDTVETVEDVETNPESQPTPPPCVLPNMSSTATDILQQPEESLTPEPTDQDASIPAVTEASPVVVPSTTSTTILANDTVPTTPTPTPKAASTKREGRPSKLKKLNFSKLIHKQVTSEQSLGNDDNNNYVTALESQNESETVNNTDAETVQNSVMDDKSTKGKTADSPPGRREVRKPKQLKNLRKSRLVKPKKHLDEGKGGEKLEVDQSRDASREQSREHSREPRPEPRTPAKERKPPSPRPPLNFIKLNKLMAGKYKRLTSQVDLKTVELKPDSPETKKREEPKKEEAKREEPKKEEAKKEEPKKKEDEPPPKSPTTKRPATSNVPVRKGAQGPKGADGKPEKKKVQKPKSAGAATKSDAANKGGQKGGAKAAGDKPNEEPGADEVVPAKDLELGSGAEPAASAAGTTDDLSAYALTSYVPNSPDLADGQGALMKVTPSTVDGYIPDGLIDTANAADGADAKNETVFAKDLENLIKLQMCLNNEIAANIENSMNYIKTLLNQDYSGSTLIEKAPTDSVERFDQPKNGLVLVEMNDDVDCSTSCSDYVDDIDKYALSDYDTGKSLGPPAIKLDLGPDTISSNIVPVVDSNVALTSVLMPDREEGYNSDSSYNCEVSITLNSNAGEADVQVQNSISKDIVPKDSVTSEIVPLDGGSSAQSLDLKPVRKKRQDKEISPEMKKKLLEILEGEIKREMALNYGSGTEFAADALALRLDESSLMNLSQGVEGGAENTEVLAQISETMRQYLYECKKRRLFKKCENSEITEKSQDEP